MAAIAAGGRIDDDGFVACAPAVEAASPMREVVARKPNLRKKIAGKDARASDR